MESPGLRTVLQKNGYMRQRLPGGILILRLLDGRAETLDAWFEDCNKLMSRWQPGQRLRYLHDIRRAEHVTPYATDRVARVIRRMRQAPLTDGRGAILLNNLTLASVLGGFFRRRSLAHWQVHFFTDEAEALRWLSEP